MNKLEDFIRTEKRNIELESSITSARIKGKKDMLDSLESNMKYLTQNELPVCLCDSCKNDKGCEGLATIGNGRVKAKYIVYECDTHK